MNAVELVITLERHGFTLIPLPEGKLAVKPADRLTDDLRQQIRQQKAEMLALLSSSPPYINEQGEVIIPFGSDPRYHWWAGGQSIAETLEELDAPAYVWRRYVAGYTEALQ